MQPDKEAVMVGWLTLGVMVISTAIATFLAIRQLRRSRVTDIEAQRLAVAVETALLKAM